MKIIAFAASNSETSINKQLVTYAASLIVEAQVEVLDLNNYEMPLFGVDIERVLGVPLLAQAFFDKIGSSDGVIISFAEYNGSYTAAYKSLFDWCSRIDKKVFQNKPLVLLATSPGTGGAANVLSTAVVSAPHFGGVVKASLSIPSFYGNFNVDEGCLKNNGIEAELVIAVNTLRNREHLI